MHDMNCVPTKDHEIDIEDTLFITTTQAAKTKAQTIGQMTLTPCSARGRVS